MKIFIFKAILAICLLGFVFLGCATPQRTVPSLPREATPGVNESELIVQYVSTFFNKAKGMIDVYVNGDLKAQVLADTSERMILPNGSYTVAIRQTGKRRISFNRTVVLETQRTVLAVNTIVNTLSLTVKDEIPLSVNVSGLSRATSEVAIRVASSLPSDTNIAVLSIASNSLQDASFVISELEYILVNVRRFQIVDRSALETVRREQNFQLSGDVSDATAVSIGEMLGASIVITGSIHEDSRNTLSIKAIDVRTSAILALDREFF